MIRPTEEYLEQVWAYKQEMAAADSSMDGTGPLRRIESAEEWLKYSRTCETIEKSEIFMIPCKDFVELMQPDVQLVKNVMRAQERKIWRLSHQLKNTMSSIYLEKKLAAKIWKLARDFGIEKEEGIEIDINMTASFLADMLGVSRETISRTCAMLIENELIKIHRKRIIVEDPEKLAVFYKTGEII